jgi:hypothetical protein
MMLISGPHSFAGYRGSVIVTRDLNRPPHVLHKDYGSRNGIGAKPDGPRGTQQSMDGWAIRIFFGGTLGL